MLKTKKNLLKMNLQYFAEGDEIAILPDDFDQPQSNDTEDAILPDDFQSEAEETVEDTKPTEETTTQTETDAVQTLKLKYNSEEREVTVEEAKALAQKGLNYEKAVERAKQEARDAYIAEQGFTWNGKPIKTEAEYKQALVEQELIAKYRDKELPEDVIQELVENRKFREQFQSKEKEQQQKEQQDAELSDFLNYYKQVEGKTFDPDNDKLPTSVWEANQKGTPLKQAYMDHKINELQSTVKVLKQNETNKSRAPIGSVTTHGSNETASVDPFEMGFDSIP